MKAPWTLLLLLLPALAHASDLQHHIPFGVDHAGLPVVDTFAGEWPEARGEMVPLPPSFFFPRDELAAGEPTFDPAVHLDLQQPHTAALLDSFELHPLGPDGTGVPRVTSARGSQLAYTSPFRLLSPAGVQVVREIVQREKANAHRSHRSYTLRGLYYRSPFMRALANDESLLAFLGNLTGEPVIPHFLVMNAWSVNFGEVATNNSVIQGTVDPWHFDSVSYVAVTILSDIEDMKGGELQIANRRKEEALPRIYETHNNLPDDEVVTVSYEHAGCCILVQGSEMMHRVRHVEWAREPRMSLILSLQPANPFQPDKSVVDTWRNFDANWGSADFEMYRLKAQTMGSALHEMARLEKPTRDGAKLAARLRAVAAELERTASLLDNSTSDHIGFVDEGKLLAARAAQAPSSPTTSGGLRNWTRSCAP